MPSNTKLLLAGVASLALLAACNRPGPTEPTVDAAAADAQVEADAAAANAEMQAREAELAQREAEIAAREAQVAQATADAQKPAPKPAAKPVVNKPVVPAAPPAPAAPRMVTVPAGTQLSLAMATALSSKSSKVGDTVRARVTQDVMIDDRVAIASGTTVAGQVMTVVSGSDKIGGVPTLGVRFERLELPGGVEVPIDGVVTQKGKSDTGRDTAKIVGGAAAGAILGHQVKGGDKGKVIGGLLGGAVGAVAAQKTGTEVTIPEGTEMAISLASAVEIARR